MDRRDKNTEISIALALCEELTNKKKLQLLEAADAPSDLLKAENKKIARSVLGDKHADCFFEKLNEAGSHLRMLENNKIHWVSVYDDDYPEALKEIDDAPLTLFLKGDVSLLHKDAIAVVGTRRPTRYGIKVAENFTRDFSNAGLVIVSGFARGIDSAAHKAAVELDNPTIAVFACGIDVCYPAENRGLYNAVLEKGGLIVSEYAMGTKPLQYHFPERNRLISGLSKAVFLPEAAKASGSLITARLAVEQGKDLFVVPGNIFSEESAGCNQLLSEIPGACCVNSEDVLTALRVKSRKTEKEEPELNLFEAKIAEFLHEGEKHFEQIAEETGLSVSELIDTLIDMELKGVIEQTGGNYYSLC